ncbi:MAG TPA: cbb3-type cytochrome c oxidase N-terminal domain-containing protein [Candidatus Kapabacteria bacterium]|nr:cbb3-type cytochrome c oxidase N-terminal domain-containing protein [Candidatus Kapabacteria bacterium]
MSKVEDKLLDHNYDGIHEYDNPLPSWWTSMFIILIVWSVGYIFYYHVAGIGGDQIDEYLAEYQSSGNDANAKVDALKKIWDNVQYVAVSDPKAISAGEKTYKANCASCHGPVCEGGIGPNLTDKNWLHGGDIEHVMKTIINGVPEKGMISWKPLLSPEQIQEVASFILTLQGSNPPNAKAPQGDVWEGK